MLNPGEIPQICFEFRKNMIQIVPFGHVWKVSPVASVALRRQLLVSMESSKAKSGDLFCASAIQPNIRPIHEAQACAHISASLKSKLDKTIISKVLL